MKRRNGDSRQNPIFEEKKKYKSSSVICDNKLIPRVRQYLDSNKHKQVVSVSSMADHLQATFSRDYGRKKKNAFKISVEKAYETILSSIKPDDSEGDTYSRLESKHLEKSRKVLVISDSDDASSDSASEKSFSSDNPDYVVHQDTNAMNSVLTSMYKRQPKAGSGVGSPVAPSKPSSISGSAPSTPRRQTGNEESDQLFLIDRTGSAAPQTQKGSLSAQEKHNTIVEDENISGISRENTSLTPQVNANSIKEKPSVSMTPNVAESKNKIIDKEPASIKNDLQTKRAEKVTDKTPATEPKQKHIGKSPRKRVKTGDKPSSKTEEKKRHELQTSKITFADIGGNDSTLKEVCKLLVHMKHPEVYERLGVTPPRGFLLHGPPGCGKTLLANAIAGELELPLLKVAATEMVSGVSGESEEKIRDMFEIAISSAPCVMFLDEIDAITPKRETASKDMERRIVSQLLTCMDDLSSSTQGHVLVIGATNRPDALDPALRRAGRFDREIGLGIPDEDARMRILKVLCRDLRLVPEFDFRQLARGTPGYVGADLMALAREAAIVAVNRVFQELQNPSKSPTENSERVQRRPSVDSREDIPAANPESSSNQNNDKTDPDHPSRITLTANPGVQRTIFESPGVPDDPPGTDTCSRSIDIEKSTEAGGEIICTMVSGETVSETKPDAALERTPAEPDSSTGGTDDEFKLVLTWLKDQPPLTPEQLDGLFLSMEDFQTALQHVQPSAKREGFVTIPDVTWADIGALQGVREELQMAIMGPVRHPEQFKALGLTNPPGILLAGPPGCGKTLLAKAVANESGINFISVKGPELLNMYVGESERAVRQVFQRARNSSPCVIFFDELDALCPRRSDSGEGGASVRVVNQLLTEMDGLEARKQVFIMGATNRPDIIDPAVMRPGRLDKLLYVGLPTAEDRLDILRTVTKNGTKPKLAVDVSLEDIAKHLRCQGFSGADLAALVREAAVAALRELMGQSEPSLQTAVVSMSHFEHALTKVRPSVTAKDQELYTRMQDRIKTS